jgi:hypothetical protein
MSIALDTSTFGRLLDLVMPGTSPDPTEARAILQIAQLAAGVDLDEDTAEHGLLGALTLQLCAIARIPISSVGRLSPLPIDAEERHAQLASLASRLVTTRSRELAYIVAYLLIVVDLELAPVETELLEELRRALWIEGRRADILAAAVSELVTPGARSDLDGAGATV